MSKKNTRNALDTSLSYAVIGLDLAKADCAVAAVPCSDDDLGLIDRMDYESLFEQAEKLKPTLFAMEPCCGYSQISLRLQNMGHEVKVISGHAVKNWIATHKSNQKTDLNDATALAKLALYDHDLQPIRVKNVEECRIASVQAIRIQLRTQATKSLVCFKSLCQCWGIVIRRGSLNTKKMAEAVAAVEKLLGAEVASSLMILRDAYKFTMKQINALDKLLDALVEALLHLLDVLLARQEHQHVARALFAVDVPHGLNRCLHVIALRCGQVPDLHGEGASAHMNDGRIVEVLRELHVV